MDLQAEQIEQYEILYNRLDRGNVGQAEDQLKALAASVAILGWRFMKHDGSYILVQDDPLATTVRSSTVRSGGAEHLHHITLVEREVSYKGSAMIVADMPLEYGYRVLSEKGDQYYYPTVRPHARPTCTCRAGEVEFVSCTKVLDGVCKHVRFARVRHANRVIPATIGSDELLAEILSKLYWDSNPQKPDEIGASFKQRASLSSNEEMSDDPNKEPF